MIRFACPACGKVYKAEDGHVGRKTACKSCGAIVVIPEPPPPQEVLYGTPLPPAGGVAATPEPDPEPSPWGKGRVHPRHENDGEPEGDDPDDEGWGSRRRSRRKPGKVGAIGGILIGGGAWAIFGNLLSITVFPLWCFWPGMYFGLVWGIFAIVRGAGLLGEQWSRQDPRTVLVLQIAQAVNLDIINVPLGIIGLVFLNERGVGSGFRRSDR